VTRTRKNLPTCALVTVKYRVVAVEIAVQPEGVVALAAPVRVQLNHAYAYVSDGTGYPLHVPGEAVS
jgi:hypothetical protein